MDSEISKQLELFFNNNFPVVSYEIINETYVLLLKGLGKKKLPVYAKEIAALTKDKKEYWELHELSMKQSSLIQTIIKYLEEKGIEMEGPLAQVDPEDLKGFTLCRSLEYSQSMQNIPLFLLTPEGYISQLPASEYIIRKGINEPLMVAKGLLPIYDPSKGPGTYMAKTPEGVDIECVNSYVPAQWQRYEGDLPDALPKEIEKLFNQVVGDLDRKYFHHWLHTMITGRNTSYLILQGEGGIGKGTIKSVMRALVGHHNFANGKKETITGAFNGALEGVKLSVFDEFKFDMQDENILKEIPNDTISIERKFQNSTKSTKLFVSMVIMNNEKRDNYLSFDGRKFAPLQLNSKRLETVITKEEIEKILAKIEDPNSETFDVAYIAQIGRWILKHGNHKKLFPQGEYRGPKFWDLCHSSMPAWKRSIIVALSPTGPLSPKDKNEIETGIKDGSLLYSKLENMIKKYQKNTNQRVPWPGDFSAVRSFLNMFRDLDGKQVYQAIDANDPVLGDFFIKKIQLEEDDGDLL